MKKKIQIAFVLLLTGAISIQAQNANDTQKATLVRQASYMIEIPSIESQIEDGTFVPAVDIVKEYNPKRSDGNKTVPGKGLPYGNDPLWEAQKSVTKYKGKEPILSFQAASSGSTPTDPTGAVGPNHYVNSWNSSFRIWDKTGSPLTPVASLGTIFSGQTMGDPIVMYDRFADRFLVTQFYSNGFLVAISQGPDPVSSGWYTYQFPTNSFPDYPKFSVWSDGYYITANKNSGSAGSSEVVYAIDRDKIIAGDASATMIGFPLPTIKTNGFYSPLGFNANGAELPPPGNAPIVYMQDDAWNGVSTDQLKIWSINVDWDTPSNSTIGFPQNITTEPFDGVFDGGSFSNLPQPTGADIDALQATIMYMAQYRRFADHNSAVFNFVVSLDGSGDLAGIRWYELRQPTDGDPWEIYQEGTYSQPDGHSAFSGTMCMDINGNIALAYTVVSETQYPSLRYTGRFSTDPLNVMTIAEESYAEGTQSDPATRYGDYSQMTIDPTDDKTFWSIAEYFSGGRKNQVGVFKIAPDLADDVGIVSIDSPSNGILTANEPITVSIRNYGIADQTNVPVSFSIDGGTVINEVFSGLISSNTNEQYTFTATGDFSTPGTSYEVFAGTGLTGDGNNINDTVSTIITHLFADDIGVITITSPESGSYLGNSETVTITIKNFGALSQSNFDVSYISNGGTPVTEQVSGPLSQESTIEYTFSTPLDLSTIGFYELEVITSLPGDANNDNDGTTAIITNSICQPELMCDQGVSISVLELGEILNETGCDPNGYGNYTNLSATIDQGTTNNLIISTGYGNVYVKNWIDFNDNFVFDTDEVVIDDFVIAPGQGAGSYTETVPLIVPNDATLGEHMMRVKINYNESVPDDACEQTTFGEAEDYTVDISIASGIGKNDLEPNDLIVTNTANNHFELSFKATTITETLIVTAHNIQGQTVLRNRVNQANGYYQYDFDMSYAPKGVYLIRLGSDTFGKVKRIVVQ